MDGHLIAFFYVNNIVLLCQKEDIPKLSHLQDQLLQCYEMRDLGQLTWFLGIRILWDWAKRKIWLCQDAYIKKLAKSFHLEYAWPAHTLLPSEELIPGTEKASPQDIYTYQHKVGSSLYAATMTWPDIARVAGKLSEFLQNPSAQHQGAANWVITYLYSTCYYAIKYSPTAIKQ